MSRLVAIEWDAKELRVLAGRKRARGVAIDRAWTISLLPADGATTVSDSEVATKLSELVQKEGLARSETLVAVGRSSIELRFLSTPPAPPEELADLVRFQALRQFTTLGDDWPLDYIELGKGTDGGTNVLAAAISPEILKQTQSVCQAAQLSLKRVALRPVAAANLLAKRHADERCRMLIDLLPSDADLSVLIGPQVIFPRTVRLPASLDPAIQSKSLVGEIRRTMIAAQNQLGGRRVDEVIIFGDGLHHAAVKGTLEKELSLEVQLLDPFSLVEVTSELKSMPEFPGTFAPLLGMLEGECSQTAETIDFLSPRKRPIPPNKRRVYVLAAAAILSLVASFAMFLYWELGNLDTKISSLSNELRRTKDDAIKLKKPREDVAQLEKFEVGDITWLDALDALSRKMPSSKEARVEELVATSIQPVGERPGGGQLIVQGLASETGVINRMEVQARSHGYNVSGSGAKYDAESPDLKWRFKEDFKIFPEQMEAIAAERAAEEKAKAEKQEKSQPAASTPVSAPAKPAAAAKGGVQ
ncbi:Fimbrial assembly family protein [Pirellula staleyi DSM 6068]|uniref:Fimbrial assembly family protein n=1 Tax=Pirellula staleyi (strain ATCC 27377 / DSM 6068 / ICPB 4128) TaxID=530564 RepID=D2QZD3_PIRSD|nr:fimbrial assembly family protein [Pirellula staleyi]ADB18325.1 Fimbrial assembly family protein [Pirellula staleyi DSM 6068]